MHESLCKSYGLSLLSIVPPKQSPIICLYFLIIELVQLRSNVSSIRLFVNASFSVLVWTEALRFVLIIMYNFLRVLAAKGCTCKHVPISFLCLCVRTQKPLNGFS